MALCYQPNIVAKDLQFAFDAANPKCYPGSGNLIYSLAGNGITGGLENGTLVSSNLAGYFADSDKNLAEKYSDSSLQLAKKKGLLGLELEAIEFKI